MDDVTKRRLYNAVQNVSYLVLIGLGVANLVDFAASDDHPPLTLIAGLVFVLLGGGSWIERLVRRGRQT